MRTPKSPGSFGIVRKSFLRTPAEDELERLYQAKCIDLGIRCVKHQQERFLETAKKHKRQRALCLNSQGLGLESCQAIGRLLQGSTEYAYISLSDNSTKDAGIALLVSHLSTCLTVTSLDVRSNSLSPDGLATPAISLLWIFCSAKFCAISGRYLRELIV